MVVKGILTSVLFKTNRISRQIFPGQQASVSAT